MKYRIICDDCEVESVVHLIYDEKPNHCPYCGSELTDDEEFWKGCQSCVNYDILTKKERKNCLCTAMLFEPKKKKPKWNFLESLNIIKRLKRIKEKNYLKKFSQLFKSKKNLKSV